MPGAVGMPIARTPLSAIRPYHGAGEYAAKPQLLDDEKWWKDVKKTDKCVGLRGASR